MKKFFSLVLALVMALSLTTMAWGAAPTPVSDETELKAALAAGEDVIFENDITVAAYEETTRVTSYTGIFVPAGVTVDGNGYTLTVTGAGDKTADGGDSAIKADDGITVKNLTIDGGARGIYIVDTPHTKNVVIDNVVIVNSCRAINVSGQPTGLTMTVSNSILAGKISYSELFAAVTFVNCEFVTNDGAKNDVVEPWGSQTCFDNCVFADGYEVNLDDAIAHDPAATIDMTDCVYAGELLTADNMDDLVVASTTIPAGFVVAATATPGAKVTFYAADGSADGWYLLDIFPGTDLDDFVADDENYLPCYEIPGYGFFTETTAAAGAFKLVYGAKTVYLKIVDWDTVYFDAKATVFTNVTDEDDVCGKLYVADLDDKDVFYSVYVKDTKTTYYFVADKSGPFQLLVNGKLVKADLTAVQDLTAHAWAGYDVVNHEYTTVKCANCGKVAPLCKNATAAGKDAFKVVVNGDTLGWIAKVANDFTAAGSVSAGTTTGKVESAETFDAGIAMYVGMSVMAAAGSAVVIGKKKD